MGQRGEETGTEVHWMVYLRQIETRRRPVKSVPQIFVVFILILAACAAPMPSVTPTVSVPPLIPTSTNVPKSTLTGWIVYGGENDIFVMDLADFGVTRLTTDPEWDFDPAWSPDGTQIVFRSHRDGNEEIYVMDADGSNQTNLSRNPGGDWSPVWSPDGTRITFFSERGGKSGIWVMDSDGKNAIPVGTPQGVNDYPTWSPDSARIAWNCTMGNMDPNGQGDFEICVANADGSGLQQLTDTEGDNKYPAWSPDGQQILFVSNRNGWPTLPEYEPLGYDPEDFGDEEIFIMNTDGTNQVNLTNNPREGDSFPAWSRDGKSIVYSRYGCLTTMSATDPSQRTQLSKGKCTGTDSGMFPDWFQPEKNTAAGKAFSCSPAISFMDERKGQVDIFAINSDGSGLQQLTDDAAQELAMSWSPDGSQLVFQRTELNGSPDLYLRNLDGSELLNLTGHPGEDWSPAWSPDGRKIAFYSDRSEGMALYWMDVSQILSDDQERMASIIPGTEMGAWPSWSPDGKQFVYRQELPGNDEIFVVDVDGTNPVNLTQHKANDLSPDWSPDGQTIIFESIRDGNYEIYAVDPDGGNLRRLTNHPLEDQHARWSPDGSAILYSHHGELYLMDPDGSNPRPFAGMSISGNFAEWRTCVNNP
jgi:Tol biopolymer transport system component